MTTETAQALDPVERDSAASHADASNVDASNVDASRADARTQADAALPGHDGEPVAHVHGPGGTCTHPSHHEQVGGCGHADHAAHADHASHAGGCGHAAHAGPDGSDQAVAAPPITIGWSDGLTIGDAGLDRTHREMVTLIEALAAADDDAMPAAVQAAIEHTEAHFRRETTLMQLHEFPPIHCHDTEHSKVLEVMHAVRAKVAAGETEYGRVLAQALMEWLHVHVPSMDTVLALWMRARGIETDA